MNYGTDIVLAAESSRSATDTADRGIRVCIFLPSQLFPFCCYRQQLDWCCWCGGSAFERLSRQSRLPFCCQPDGCCIFCFSVLWRFRRAS